MHDIFSQYEPKLDSHHIPWQSTLSNITEIQWDPRDYMRADRETDIKLIWVLPEYASAPENPTIYNLYLSELEF